LATAVAATECRTYEKFASRQTCRLARSRRRTGAQSVSAAGPALRRAAAQSPLPGGLSVTTYAYDAQARLLSVSESISRRRNRIGQFRRPAWQAGRRAHPLRSLKSETVLVGGPLRVWPGSRRWKRAVQKKSQVAVGRRIANPLHVRSCGLTIGWMSGHLRRASCRRDTRRTREKAQRAAPLPRRAVAGALRCDTPLARLPRKVNGRD
jgi:hypothetical protein